MKSISLLIATCLLLAKTASSQPKANYDEEAILPYTLPPLLVNNSGRKVENIADWEHTRRKEIFALFEQEMFGKVPKTDALQRSVSILEESDSALHGKAIRKQFALTFAHGEKNIRIQVLLYLPKNVPSPPVFVSYNFYGNHTTVDDPAVMLTPSWIPNNKGFGITEHKATEASRGVRTSRWPMEKIVENGFGIATVYYGDVDPDRDDFTDGVHPLFYAANQTKPKPDEWGAIAAWAWGASRVLDYLKEAPYTNASKFIMFGHSRLGKASLWAGASDQRFDAVISNDSGCGGAALSRRKIGETVAIINSAFPHWFADNFNEYNGKEENLPYDQHMLIALMAPRPVYIASAAEDLWADPKGEFLSGHFASPAYALYKKTGLPSEQQPAISEPIHHSGIGYHIRPGKHDVKDYDWEQYMAFCRKNL
ncbi:acetylxylan esterase [Marinilongibacter aquaticus]|uniref:glucuronyl esterase domain-containing protein n=1 Tax=Marinilongibacter aquaticus TaxID=2975157 RepID=UPI0021BCFDB0|nr:acetylxylan esterase [Marinilongibacter aquaticus]UBM57345.1 acetylxylan esterase [Marinilongibacter aquaticus]